MGRLLRSRAVLVATGLLLVAVVGAALVAAGSVRAGAALAVVALAALLWWCVLALTRLEWLQRTQHRSLVERVGEVAATGRTARGAGGPTPRPTGLVGRAAAGSPVETPRAELLVALPVPGAASGRPVVAGVVTRPLAAALAEVADVVALNPWLVLRTLEEAAPRALVVEEAALRDGVWHGVETSSGLALLGELEAALAWCAEAAVPVLGVPGPGTGGVSTPLIRARYSLTFPTDDDLRPEGTPAQPLLEALQGYARRLDRPEGTRPEGTPA